MKANFLHLGIFSFLLLSFLSFANQNIVELISIKAKTTPLAVTVNLNRNQYTSPKGVVAQVLLQNITNKPIELIDDPANCHMQVRLENVPMNTRAPID